MVFDCGLWCLRLGLEVKLQRAGRFRVLGFRDLQACLGLGADSLFRAYRGWDWEFVV